MGGMGGGGRFLDGGSKGGIIGMGGGGRDLSGAWVDHWVVWEEGSIERQWGRRQADALISDVRARWVRGARGRGWVPSLPWRESQAYG